MLGKMCDSDESMYGDLCAVIGQTRSEGYPRMPRFCHLSGCRQRVSALPNISNPIFSELIVMFKSIMMHHVHSKKSHNRVYIYEHRQRLVQM